MADPGTIDGASAIARILEREGVERFFLFPDNKLIDPCARLGIAPTMARSERAAIAMADGYTRAHDARRLGVVIVQFGPGIENSFGAVAQAYSDSSPILVVCGQLDQGRIDSQPAFDAVRSFRDVTKWAVRINRAQRIPELLRRAFTYLRNGRPGPVLVEVPDDVMGEAIAIADVEDYLPVRATRSVPDATAIAEVTDALTGARRPLLHAGHGVLYARATAELVELAELLDAPVMTTLAGKSAFPEDHPLSVGTGARAAPRAAARFLADADVIFGIGSSFSIGPYSAPLPRAARLIQATIDDRDLNKDYAVHQLLIGDARLTMRAILDELAARGTERRTPTVAPRIAAIAAEDRREWQPRREFGEAPMSPYRVIDEIARALAGRPSTVTHDAGSPRDQLSPFWVATVPRSYIGWGKSTHLGYGYGLALGAKLALPDRIVLNFMGDAAIGMSGMEIETAVRLRIPIVTIVLNNGAMACYEERYPYAVEHHRLKYLGGDYAALARALGAHAERVERPAEIGPALERALAANTDGVPALLDVATVEDAAYSRYW